LVFPAFAFNGLQLPEVAANKRVGRAAILGRCCYLLGISCGVLLLYIKHLHYLFMCVACALF